MSDPEDLSRFHIDPVAYDRMQDSAISKAMSPTVEFTHLLRPIIFLDQPGHRHEMYDRLSAEDRNMYASVGAAMGPPENPLFENMIKRGRYDELAGAAHKLSREIGEAQEITLPKAFAAHAVTASYCRMNMADPEKFPHTYDRTTYFLTQFAGRLAMQVAPNALFGDLDPHEFRESIGQRTIALVAESAREDPAWFQAKLRVLADRMLLRRHTLVQIEAEPAARVDNTKELRSYSSDLFQELRRLKRFSIKSAVHEAGGTYWSIHDSYNGLAEISAEVERQESQIWLDRWPLMVLDAIEHGDIGNAMVVHSHNFDENPAAHDYGRFKRRVHMNQAGELFADPHESLPYKELYASIGKPRNYEVLRQFFMQKYFDLTVSGDVVEKVVEATQKMTRTAHWRNREPGTIVTNLLLPRIMVLRKIKSAAEMDAMDEAEQNEISSEADKIRQRAHHRAVQKRRLPAGHQPSAQAIELAKTHNIILGPGETCVKQHRRGDPELGWVVNRVRDRTRGSEF